MSRCFALGATIFYPLLLALTVLSAGCGDDAEPTGEDVALELATAACEWIECESAGRPWHQDRLTRCVALQGDILCRYSMNCDEAFPAARASELDGCLERFADMGQACDSRSWPAECMGLFALTKEEP